MTIAAILLSALLAAPSVASEVEAPGPSGPLRGTMLAPSGTEKPPVMLIIPGSGPTDRDGNSPLGLRGSSYRLLAEGLAEQGVATLRIDKRGMFGSAKAVPDANAVTVADYVADIRAWMKVAQEKTGAPCTWLLGHSEGGLVVLAAAAKSQDICGVVLAAAPGRRLSDVLREQIGANPANAPIMADATKALDALDAGKPVDVSAMHPALQGLFAPQIQAFLISLYAHDPATLAAASKRPLLIIQGTNDIQVKEADARRLAAARPDATLLMLPDVTHMLKVLKESGMAAQVAHYADPSAPLAPGLAEAIAGFVKQAR